jgi:hypothetical protein
MFKKVLGIISGKRQRQCHCNVNVVKAISTGSYYNKQECKERQVNLLYTRFVLGCFESYVHGALASSWRLLLPLYTIKIITKK